MANSPLIGILLPEQNGAGQETVVTEAIVMLEALGNHIIVEDKDLTAAPALTSPADDGKVYKIGTTAPIAADPWETHFGFALFYNGGWIFKDAVEDGQTFHAKDETTTIYVKTAGGTTTFTDSNGDTYASITIP